MSAVNRLNASADVVEKNQALILNITAAKSLMNIIKTNLGPKGTLKLLVSGSGDLVLTKDGNVLLKQMQIQHPTASLIARTATAQDDITGDGTTSNVLLTAELLKQSERYVAEGLHPRVLVEGIEIAREEVLKFLDSFAVKSDRDERSLLMDVARTSLRTKLDTKMADLLTHIVVDAVLCIRREDKPIDLHMVEVMEMKHQSETDTKLVRGLVLDHGARHPSMSRYNKNCYILTCNVSLEYEKSEVASGFFYSNAEERQKMVQAERGFTNQKVQRVIDFKNQVCADDPEKSFVIINQKGIDPISLDMLQKNGIVGIRRAKRRNMERLTLSCGGYAVNSVDDLDPSCLGYADEVYEHVLGEDKFTFIEGVKNPHSCTILIKGPHKHGIKQMKDAVRDGLRAIKNVMEDGRIVPGAAAFEVAASIHLQNYVHSIQGRKKLGVQAFADALLVIPKVLASNAGLDAQDCILELLQEARKGHVVGLDLLSGKPISPMEAGIIDNYCVKRQLLHLGSIMATKLLLVDEIMRAGRTASGRPPQ